MQDPSYQPLQPVAESAQPGTGYLSTLPPPIQPSPPTLGTSGPLSYGPSTFGTSASVGDVPLAPSVQYDRPAAAGALKAQQLPPAMEVPQEHRAKDGESDDEEDDSNDDGQTAENAPKPPPGALHPSEGSEAHEEGTCKRCCFFPRNRCLNGYNCEFCHYEHEKRKRKSKKSKKKNKDGGQPDGSESAVPATSSSSPPPNQSPGAIHGTAQGYDRASVDAAAYHAAAGAAAAMGQPGLYEPWLQPPLPSMPPGGFPMVNADALMTPLPPRGLDNAADAQTGASQLITYQWRDGIPGSSPLYAAAQAQVAAAAAQAQAHAAATSPSYFGSATGFTPQSLGGMDGHWPGAFAPPPGQPSLGLPYNGYPGMDAEHHWAGLPGQFGACPYQTPGAPPAFLAPHDNSLSPPQGAPPGTAPRGFAPPPAEEPKLPEALQQNGDSARPPMEAPRLPPTVQCSDQGDPHAPPPSCSPKLPKDLVMSMQQEAPPVPGDAPS